ncbi:galactokinase [Parvularcula sp. LCG005]|uniref:galactokinase n=1 Tax=Parvularcula sp. LCG005 TaxID=3078805 RepID=UPI0029422957|nr:galactokinase [Parvularcula sp. LCG005]WOI53293.1 galactokinase [Parvularcula sp. LCG005]
MKTFTDYFGHDPAVSVRVPGRVNLIGEHIDYTGGTVLPTPIPRFLNLAMSPGSQNVRIASTRFEEIVERPLTDQLNGHWSDYALAGHRMAVARGLLSGGAEYWIDSDVPHGAGVSSSAALLVALLKAASEQSVEDIDPKTIALWAQAVESDDIGMPCGIMDQMAVALGEPGQALALNTADLSTDLIPLPPSVAFPVYHSGLTRALADGQYASRRKAIEDAKTAIGLENISLASDEQLEQINALPEPAAKRARHAVTEHRRVMEAVDALKAGDTERFGALMTESHVSMRDDFEITVPAMDRMAERAVAAGAYGSRLTGGGFGGCFVSCVPLERLSAWKDEMESAFPDIRLITDGVTTD